MTKITFFTTDPGWQGFRAVGHTGFREQGEDVVCAAVSALTQTAVIGLIEVLEINCTVEIDEERGSLSCLLPLGLSQELWEKAQLVLKVLHSGLSAIVNEREYRKYVCMREVPYRENESTTFRNQKRGRKHT